MPYTACVDFDDVDAYATSLPGVTVGARWGNRTWMVNERGFAWQRPFSKADLKRFGDETPPQGEILAVSVESLDAKDALLAIAPPGFFTIPHFNGYPAVLKAMIDSAYRPWHAKPVAFVSYGGISGGLRAVEQLRQVFAELHAVAIRDTVSLAHVWSQFDSQGHPFRPAQMKGPLIVMMRRLFWWARALRNARAETVYDSAAA